MLLAKWFSAYSLYCGRLIHCIQPVLWQTDTLHTACAVADWYTAYSLYCGILIHCTHSVPYQTDTPPPRAQTFYIPSSLALRHLNCTRYIHGSVLTLFLFILYIKKCVCSTFHSTCLCCSLSMLAVCRTIYYVNNLTFCVIYGYKHYATVLKVDNSVCCCDRRLLCEVCITTQHLMCVWDCNCIFYTFYAPLLQAHASAWFASLLLWHSCREQLPETSCIFVHLFSVTIV